MKLATFNLFQFVASGYYWHDRDARNTYTAAEWEQKKQWVSTRLHEMDADIVGFQEVFSIPELQTLCAAIGYPYFLTVDQSVVKPHDPQVYKQSVVALASRYPIHTVHRVEMQPEVLQELALSTDFQFSRRPVCADITIPDFGVLTVYVLHLKSKRPVSLDMRYHEQTSWSTRIRDTLTSLSRGTIASLLQRGAEATMLYHNISKQLQDDANRPIVVLGDLNDGLNSVPLAALTMQERVHSIGGIFVDAWPAGTQAALHNYQLADSFRLAPNMRTKVRPCTIIHHGQGNVLDHILVSNSLNPKNPAAIAEVHHYGVWNQHLDADGIENRLQSDHGQVCVTLLPCNLSSVATNAVNQYPAHSVTQLTDIVTRDDFVQYAGGIFQSPKHFKHWNSTDKWENFWSFFFDSSYGWVSAVYGSVPISELYQKQRHSIEHVIPRDFLDRYLSHKGMPRNVRYGATVNPFNMVPAERTLNAKRGNFPFDMDGNQIVRPIHLALHPEQYAATGFDADHEWVIPSSNRGDIARAILYMLLVYEIDELYNQHINTLVHWAKVDSPSAWEVAYNHWVYARLGIRNPFIDTPENALQLLNKRDLLHVIAVQ